MNQRIERQFDSRTDVERQWMLDNTWCNSCNAADLGMSNPQEYSLGEQIYVEGDCNKCGNRVVSEVHERDVTDS